MFLITRPGDISIKKGENIFLNPVDLAIEFCKLAEESLKQNDRTDQDYFDLAIESVKTLADRVSIVYGGESALVMQSEYRFIFEQIESASRTGDVESIRAAIRILEYIRQQTLTFIAAARDYPGGYSAAVA
ncbi:MAG: flagellar protein FliS [Candidatus Komeilibacteria bacterium]|nr:flagellar protein FliS [Candidatus Komeilibacteria bacterium]